MFFFHHELHEALMIRFWKHLEQLGWCQEVFLINYMYVCFIYFTDVLCWFEYFFYMWCVFLCSHPSYRITVSPHSMHSIAGPGRVATTRDSRWVALLQIGLVFHQNGGTKIVFVFWLMIARLFEAKCLWTQRMLVSKCARLNLYAWFIMARSCFHNCRFGHRISNLRLCHSWLV